MKKQKVVRTYPSGYSCTTKELRDALNEGYTVVMCNEIELEFDKKGLEYVLEKEVKQ